MTVQEISLVVQMRRILSDRNMFSTLNSLANIKVFNKNSLLSTIFFEAFPNELLSTERHESDELKKIAIAKLRKNNP